MIFRSAVPGIAGGSLRRSAKCAAGPGTNSIAPKLSNWKCEYGVLLTTTSHVVWPPADTREIRPLGAPGGNGPYCPTASAIISLRCLRSSVTGRTTQSRTTGALAAGSSLKLMTAGTLSPSYDGSW